LTTGTFQLTDGAELNASTTGTGPGGTITVTANTFNVDSTGTINTSTTGPGSGGTITVNATTLTGSSAGRFVTTTSGPGAAGNVVLNVVDRIFLTGQGTGIFANATETSTGPGGSILIDPRLVELRDGATISVGSLGTGLGGSISLQAGSLLLDNASLSAVSNSADGGNITLSVNDLILLRNGSNVSATAGVAQSNGNGGNVTIATRFLVAPPFEDSNISANAFTGRGGNIRISAQALFGIGFQPRPTRLSDITASSEFGVNGIVLITTPGIDPSKGLEALTAEAVDASNLISQECAVGSNVSRFILTGRGGLPPNPTEAISGDSVLDDTRLPDRPTSQRLTSPTAVVPAQGWILKENGDVTLTAQLIPTQCNVR
ncbi:MAG: hypothetical protein SFW36_23155, partial [Leptolyngbyaceae cyanobacterium bins.59]|nr:hypothetical protein [Leptolyngbyaceae cyanobacterium bins.59]